MKKYKREEKGDMLPENALTNPNTLMEVDKALKQIGKFFQEIEIEFTDQNAQADFFLAQDDFNKCNVLFGNIVDEYEQNQTITETSLLAILAIISEIKTFVISNIESDENLFSSGDIF